MADAKTATKQPNECTFSVGENLPTSTAHADRAKPVTDVPPQFLGDAPLFMVWHRYRDFAGKERWLSGEDHAAVEGADGLIEALTEDCKDATALYVRDVRDGSDYTKFALAEWLECLVEQFCGGNDVWDDVPPCLEGRFEAEILDAADENEYCAAYARERRDALKAGWAA